MEGIIKQSKQYTKAKYENEGVVMCVGDYRFTSKAQHDDFNEIGEAVENYLNGILLRKEKTLKEQIELLQKQLTDTQYEIKTNEPKKAEILNNVYNHLPIIKKDIVKSEGGNNTFNKERNYQEYFKNGEEVIHRLHKTKDFKDKGLDPLKPNNSEDYGTIKLDHDLTNLKNIWRCKYDYENNHFVRTYPKQADQPTYKTLKKFIEAHNEAEDHKVNKGIEGIWKGAIKVIRQSIKPAKHGDKNITIYKLSCLSKIDKLENYHQPRPRINMTK